MTQELVADAAQLRHMVEFMQLSGVVEQHISFLPGKQAGVRLQARKRRLGVGFPFLVLYLSHGFLHSAD